MPSQFTRGLAPRDPLSQMLTRNLSICIVLLRQTELVQPRSVRSRHFHSVKPKLPEQGCKQEQVMSTQSNQSANPGQQTDLGKDTQRQGGGLGQPGQAGQPEKVPEPRPADAGKTDTSGRNAGEPGFGTDDDTPQQGGM